MEKRDFADAIIALGVGFQISVTSWGRTEAHNKAVGGVPDSKHLAWLAVDVVVDAGESHSDVKFGAEKLGLEVIVESDHLHIMAPRVKP